MQTGLRIRHTFIIRKCVGCTPLVLVDDLPANDPFSTVHPSLRRVVTAPLIPVVIEEDERVSESHCPAIVNCSFAIVQRER
ncbi:unnamed protein product [Chondrus crispus]|uniref:Uncharacterized protein n=1 Tax=Chondrus crispus TaxID=2769 RepID=R7QT04_CHOCR|nr:unnamed protein product [Chondrus crispus]CDF41269.1 unnamed protein product [Chondrus crispus]|eukprot:XP_005711563.1 unnamed protein product [Chondrus crispus]